MTSTKRIKRELLREVVAENQHLRGGSPGPRPHLRRRRVPLAGRLALGGVLGVLVLVAANTLSTDGPAPPTAGTAAGTAAGAAAVEMPQQHRAAPRAVDPDLFNLPVRSVILDAGHGGSDPGALTIEGVQEKDLTLDIARRVRVLLEQASFTVAMTREGDSYLSLRDRARLANEWRGDVFVSIHVNSIPKPQRRGIETYYLGPSDDPSLSTLVAAENRESGYSLADYRALLDQVYSGVRQGESETFARFVQSSLVRSLHRRNPALQDRGVKSAPFVVLIGTEMPGILAEVSCLSNQEEVGLLLRDDYRDTIAQALFAGIRNYAAARSAAGKRGA